MQPTFLLLTILAANPLPPDPHSLKFRTVCVSATFVTATFETALPSSTRRCSPVAVVTTSASRSTACVMTKSSVAVSSGAVRTDLFCS